MISRSMKRLRYYSPVPVTNMQLVFASSTTIADRSIVVLFEWNPDGDTETAKLNLTWSHTLDSYYAYAPEVKKAGFWKGPGLNLPTSGTLVLSFLSWPSRKELDINPINGVFLYSDIGKNGTNFSTLQRITEGENENG